MKIIAFISVLTVVVAGACATAPADAISRSEKRTLLGLTTPDFKLDAAHEQWTYGILRAVKPILNPGEKVAGIRFGLLDGVTVFFSPPAIGMHGGDSVKATFDGHEWKIGERWRLM